MCRLFTIFYFISYIASFSLIVIVKMYLLFFLSTLINTSIHTFTTVCILSKSLNIKKVFAKKSTFDLIT